MPANHQTAKNSPDPEGEGVWQPDLDADLSKQVRRAHREAERPPRVVEPDHIWMPNSGNTRQHVTVDEYHRDPSAASPYTTSDQLTEEVGTPPDYLRIPVAAAPRDSWKWVAAALGLIIAILLFRTWGIPVFLFGVFAFYWLSNAYSNARNNE